MYKYMADYTHSGQTLAVDWDYHSTLYGVKNTSGNSFEMFYGGGLGNGSTSSSNAKKLVCNREIYVSSTSAIFYTKAGTSNRAASLDDYDLAAYDSDISCSVSNYLCTMVSDTKFKRSVTVTCTNNSDSSKTIKEIGFYKKVYTTSFSSVDEFLFMRQVITSTTIPAGGSTNITIDVEDTISSSDCYTKNYYMYTWYMDFVNGRNDGFSSSAYSFPLIIKTDGTGATFMLGDDDNYYSHDIVDTYCNRILYSLSANVSSGRTTGWFAKAGTSNRAFSFNDTELGAPSNSVSCSIESNIITNVGTDFKFVRTLFFKLTNSTNSDVEIKEIGLYKHLGDYASNTDRGNFLFMRKVLTKPVTVKANASEFVIFALEDTY